MGGERGGKSNHEHVQSGRVHHRRHRFRRRPIPTLAHRGEELYARGVARIPRARGGGRGTGTRRKVGSTIEEDSDMVAQIVASIRTV